MKRLTVLVTAIVFSAGAADAQNTSVEDVHALGIGKTLTIQHRVCDLATTKKNEYREGTVSVPTGLEILSAEPVVVSKWHNAWIEVDEVSQPGQVTVQQALGGERTSGLTESARKIGGEAHGEQLAAAIGSFSLASIIEGNTHAKYSWSCFADGKKFGSKDGQITGDVRVTLIKGPSLQDVSEVMLKLATLIQPVTQEAVTAFLESIDRIVRYDRTPSPEGG